MLRSLLFLHSTAQYLKGVALVVGFQRMRYTCQLLRRKSLLRAVLGHSELQPRELWIALLHVHFQPFLHGLLPRFLLQKAYNCRAAWLHQDLLHIISLAVCDRSKAWTTDRASHWSQVLKTR